MEFIKIAYCVTIPFLLLFTLAKPVCRRYAINLLSVSNVLLIGHSVFLFRQLLGGYQLAKRLSIDFSLFSSGTLLAKVILVIVLPFMFLNGRFRKNRLLSVLVWILLYAVFPYATWNTYGLLFKIPGYLCLLCSAYALFWLLKQLPYQSR